MTRSLPFKQFGAAAVLAIGVMLCNAQAHAQQVTAIDAAVIVATQWAALADENEAERMWSDSSALMQKSTSKEDWARYVANLRNELGSLEGREWAQVVRLGQPVNLPKGEYLNVVFSSRFDNARAAESVSLVQTIGGRWMPVGYVVRKIQPVTSGGSK